jgi:hypothetical protein
MSIRLITYDLREQDKDYPGLFDAIKKLGSWWHCLESVWLVRTDQSSAQVRDALSSHLKMNDSLMVTGLTGNWATLGLNKDCTEWLRLNLNY